MNTLKQYLQNATRGIWGKRKLEILEELENHILERSKKYELEGSSREMAVLQVLEQLGNPQKLSFGFWEVYMSSQKQWMFGSLMVALLIVAAIWQMTLPRNLKFSCSTKDHSTWIEGTTSATWFNVFGVARDLEKLEFVDYSMQQVKDTMMESENGNIFHSEAKSGQFKTSNQKYITLQNPKFTIQPSTTPKSNELHCVW